jgi:hypothetical protein
LQYSNSTRKFKAIMSVYVEPNMNKTLTVKFNNAAMLN